MMTFLMGEMVLPFCLQLYYQHKNWAGIPITTAGLKNNPKKHNCRAMSTVDPILFLQQTLDLPWISISQLNPRGLQTCFPDLFIDYLYYQFISRYESMFEGWKTWLFFQLYITLPQRDQLFVPQHSESSQAFFQPQPFLQQHQGQQYGKLLHRSTLLKGIEHSLIHHYSPRFALQPYFY